MTEATYRVRMIVRRRTVVFAVVRVGPKGSRTNIDYYPNEKAAAMVAGLLTRLEGLDT